MAEIHVERKRGTGAWLWVVLLVILLVAAAVWAWQAGYINLGAADADALRSKLAMLNAGGANGA